MQPTDDDKGKSKRSKKTTNLANDSGGLRPRKTAWCILKTLTHTNCFHKLGSSSDIGSLKWDRLCGYKAAEDEDFQEENTATAVSLLQLSPTPVLRFRPATPGLPFWWAARDARLQSASYLSCSSWETPCLNVTHVLMFSDFWTDYLILKPHLTKSLPDHVFLSWNKTRGFTPVCILHLGPTVIPGSKWREMKTNNMCTAVIPLLLGIGVNFRCDLQVLATSEIPSLLSTDDVCLASSNSYHQLTPREQVCLWVGSGWDDECLLQAWGELRRSFRDGDATPACCGTERFQPERKLSIYLSATLMSQR